MWKEICEFFAKIEKARQDFNNAPPKAGTLGYPGSPAMGGGVSSAGFFKGLGLQGSPQPEILGSRAIAGGISSQALFDDGRSVTPGSKS